MYIQHSELVWDLKLFLLRNARVISQQADYTRKVGMSPHVQKEKSIAQVYRSFRGHILIPYYYL